jgi:hypothetical protein
VPLFFAAENEGMNGAGCPQHMHTPFLPFLRLHYSKAHTLIAAAAASFSRRLVQPPPRSAALSQPWGAGMGWTARDTPQSVLPPVIIGTTRPLSSARNRFRCYDAVFSTPPPPSRATLGAPACMGPGDKPMSIRRADQGHQPYFTLIYRGPHRYL